MTEALKETADRAYVEFLYKVFKLSLVLAISKL